LLPSSERLVGSILESAPIGDKHSQVLRSEPLQTFYVMERFFQIQQRNTATTLVMKDSRTGK